MAELLQAQVTSAGLWAAMAAVGLAGLVRGFSGMGLGLVGMPVLSIVYGPAQAIVILLLLQALTTVQMVPPSIRHCDGRLVLTLSLAAGACLPLGVWLLRTLEPELVRRLIAVFVVICAVTMMAGFRYTRRPGPVVTLAVAGFSGLATGFTGIGGPPVALYLFSGPESARQNRHNLIMYFAALNGVALTVFALFGLLLGSSFVRALLLTPAIVLGVRGGQWLYMRASDALLRRAALWLILLIGVVGLVK